jgi:hypothetical protein
VTRSLVASAWGRGGDEGHEEGPGRVGVVGDGRGDGGDPWCPGQRSAQRLHRLARLARFAVVAVGARPGRRDHGEQEGPVEPVPEALGQQVVGPAGVAALGEVALVGDAEPETQDR